MAFVDRTLTCRDCGVDFVFSAGEQEFFATKGFDNEPTRCTECRSRRKRQNGPGGRAPRSDGRSMNRTMHAVVCASCGTRTEVPFQPRGDRPVYCRDCFSTQRSSQRRA